MYLRAFLSLVFACIKTSAALGFLLGTFIAVKSVFNFGEGASAFLAAFPMALLAGLLGPFLAFPAIILGTFLCCFLAKKSHFRQQDFILCGAILSGIYGVTLQLTTTFDHALFFIIAGPITGWLMWKDIPFYCKDQKILQVHKK